MPTSVRSGKSTPGQHHHDHDEKDEDDEDDDENDDEDDDDDEDDVNTDDVGLAPSPPPRQPHHSQRLVVRPGAKDYNVTLLIILLLVTLLTIYLLTICFEILLSYSCIRVFCCWCLCQQNKFLLHPICPFRGMDEDR